MRERGHGISHQNVLRRKGGRKNGRPSERRIAKLKRGRRKDRNSL
jgi:hypothetical protein